MNKVDSIFLQRYKRLDGYQIKNELIKFFEENDAPLTDKQRLVLQDACDGGFYSDMWLPFQAYKHQKNVSETSNMWWRLTIPLFFIWWFVMALLMPFKWLFTGKWHYDAEDFGVPLLRKWYVKIFNNE